MGTTLIRVKAQFSLGERWTLALSERQIVQSGSVLRLT